VHAARPNLASKPLLLYLAYAQVRPDIVNGTMFVDIVHPVFECDPIPIYVFPSMVQVRNASLRASIAPTLRVTDVQSLSTMMLRSRSQRAT
jgi:hypothetical protein